MMRSWDLNVTASIGSAKIQDLFTKGEGEILFFSPVSSALH